VIRKVFERFDPGVGMASLDEAYMDVSEYVSSRTEPIKLRRIRYKGKCACRLPLLKSDDVECLDGESTTEYQSEECSKCSQERVAVIDCVEFGTGVEEVVKQIRFEVEQATGLTCSAGIASNGLLAKICSDMRKPNGQFCLISDRDTIVGFMRNLPIRKVSGIGAVSEGLLNALNVHTCGQIFDMRSTIRLLFSECSFTWLLRVSLGISEGGDSSKHELNHHQKSTSVERTFNPQRDSGELLRILKELSDDLFQSLPADGIEGGRSATLKIKFASFDVITRCHSANFLIQSAKTFYPIVEKLLRKELKNNIAIRLLGVRLSLLEFMNDDDYDDDAIAKASKRHSERQRSLMDFIRRPIWRRGMKKERQTQTARSGGTPPTVIELSSDSEEDGGGGNGEKCEEIDLLDISNDDTRDFEEAQENEPPQILVEEDSLASTTLDVVELPSDFCPEPTFDEFAIGKRAFEEENWRKRSLNVVKKKATKRSASNNKTPKRLKNEGMKTLRLEHYFTTTI